MQVTKTHGILLTVALMVGMAAGKNPSAKTSLLQTEDPTQGPSPKVSRTISATWPTTGTPTCWPWWPTCPSNTASRGGDTTPFRGKAGHTMQVTGLVSKSDPREIVLNANMLDATKGVGYDTITADSVQDVLSNCSLAGFERHTR
jgi:hypothetical protein